METVVQSKRGKQHIVNNGYVYRCYRTVTDFKYYRCIKLKCKGTMKKNAESIMVFSGEHCHPPDEESIEKRKCEDMMKKRARTETISIPRIFNDEVTKFMDAGLNFVSVPPTYDSLRTSLYRQRHKGII